MKKIPAMPALLSRVLGCYWPVWNGPALSAIPSGYNTIWLFAAVPVGGPSGTTGVVYWSQNREATAPHAEGWSFKTTRQSKTSRREIS